MEYVLRWHTLGVLRLFGRSALDDHHLRSWRDDGFVILKGFFNPAMMRKARAHLDSMWALRGRCDNPLVIDTMIGSPSERRQYFRDASADLREHPYKLNDAFLTDAFIRKLALAPRLSRILEQLLDGRPCICNSLQLEYGSQQALHVDTFYMPPPEGGRLVASWICLEDVHPDAGPLQYVRGSHEIPPFMNVDGSRHVRSAEEDAQATRYYQAMTAERSMRSEPFLGQCGDVFIWHEQLLHGGTPITDLNRTRSSLVTHYWRVNELGHLRLNPHGHGYWVDRPHNPVAA